MAPKIELPENVFIFSEKNNGFITGESHQLGGEGAVQRTIKFAAMFYISLGLPIGIILALIGTILSQVSFVYLFATQAIVMLLLSAYVGWVGYRVRRKLELKGRVLIGEVDSYDTRMSFGTFGYKKVPRLKYSFQAPSGTKVEGHTLIPPRNARRLPDGRELPMSGTPVAVLYLDDKRHTVL